MQKIKPKLGNASTLFTNNEPKGLNALVPKDPKSRNWIGWIAACMALACLMLSVFLFQQNNTIAAKEHLKTMEEAADDTIAVVRAESDSGQLVGTLVRMETSDEETPFSAEQPMKLTEQERQHLLDIISNQ